MCHDRLGLKSLYFKTIVLELCAHAASPTEKIKQIQFYVESRTETQVKHNRYLHSLNSNASQQHWTQ